MKSIEKKAAELAAPICAGLGLALWDVDYVREGGNYFLRVYIDKPDGSAIAIEDCAAVSRAMDIVLDQQDLIDQHYTLEVCSPGIDRPLKKPEDFVRYKGELVDVKLYKPINKSKVFQGRLEGLLDGTLVLVAEGDGSRLEFPWSAVASCRLAVVF